MSQQKNNEKHAKALSAERKTLSNTERDNHPVQIILLLHGGQLAGWQTTPGLPPKALPIKGETRLRVRDAAALASAWEDLSECLRGDGMFTTHALWIADAPGRQWCAAKALATWQLPWEWLAQRFGLDAVAPWEVPEPLHTHILPWLTTADDSAQRQQLQQRRERDHTNETERLAAERAALEQENDHLRARNAALQQVDAERLVSFLPALFPRVFTVLGAADLALLCGRVEPLAIANPYPEPSEETLRTLQKRFCALPQQLQQQIVRFIASLPQRRKLQPRPEMRDLVLALEEN